MWRCSGQRQTWLVERRSGPSMTVRRLHGAHDDESCPATGGTAASLELSVFRRGGANSSGGEGTTNETGVMLVLDIGARPYFCVRMKLFPTKPPVTLQDQR